MTLIELLIVVTVMVILLGLALPMLKTGLEGRRLREASRQLNTYVELAKAQAAETGRPAGLILDVETLPENGLPYVSQVFLAQTPRPYVGDMVTARATIALNLTTFVYTATFDAIDSASLTSLVRPGDQIRFDYRGILYSISAINTATYTITFTGSPLPPNGATLPYQIFRQPEKSASAPMEMASGTVIDLSMSGFGMSDEFRFDNTIVGGSATVETQFVVIVFSPSGRMTRVLVNKYNHSTNSPVIDTYTPTNTLHLLVSEIDGVLLDDIANVDTTDDVKTIIENPDSLWVSIGHQTGRVTTGENGWTINDPYSMRKAREFAQSGKAVGGG